MKKLLITVGIIILVFIILYIFVFPTSLNSNAQTRFQEWKNGRPTGKATTPGSNNPVLLDTIQSKLDCEKAGKKWIQPQCIKAPCPGQCN